MFKTASLSQIVLMCIVCPATVAQAAEFMGLGHLEGAPPESHARAVSTDGSTVIGNVGPGGNRQGFRWTETDGLQGPGYLEGGDWSSARDVSANGSVIAGESRNGHMEAFRWTAETGMVGLGTLAGRAASNAEGVSADGSVVIGFAHPAAAACREF